MSLGDFECVISALDMWIFQTLITCLSETNSSTGDNNSPTMGLGLITRIPYFLLWDETNF